MAWGYEGEIEKAVNRWFLRSFKLSDALDTNS